MLFMSSLAVSNAYLRSTEESNAEVDPIFAAAATTLSETSAREDMQTFVFSATLSKELQNNLKRRQRVGKKGRKATALGQLSLLHVSDFS
jgi:hypothetical protein